MCIEASCKDLSIKWLMMSVLARCQVLNTLLLISYFVRLDLRARPRKIQKYYFFSMGSREHAEWCGATYSNTGELKVTFSTKMTKMPLVNPSLTKSQTKSKFPLKNTFHSFISNPSFLEIFGNFDQVWLEVDSQRALETLILIWLSKRVETNVIVKITKFSV